MLIDTDAPYGEPGAATRQPRPTVIPPNPELRVLTVGDYLYQEGDTRTHYYKMAHGAVAIFDKCVGRPNHTVEIAAQGDFVGLGCFEQYCDNARAIRDSVLTCFEENEFVALAKRDPVLGKKQAHAIAREFERRKTSILNRGASTPVECLAAFLVSISRQNVHEGRAPSIVSDSLKCNVVASLLGLDIDTLAQALLELKGMGFIKELQNGRLHLIDLENLKCLADGLQPVASPI